MSFNIVSIAIILAIALYFVHDIAWNSIIKKVIVLIACIVIVLLSMGYRNKSVSLYRCERTVASLQYDIDHFND